MISSESSGRIAQEPITPGTDSTHDARIVPAPVAPSRKLSVVCAAVAAAATSVALTDVQTWRSLPWHIPARMTGLRAGHARRFPRPIVAPRLDHGLFDGGSASLRPWAAALPR